MPNYRSDRINEEVKKHVAAIIREMKDHRIPDVVSIVSAEVSKDLKHAKLYVSTIGDMETIMVTVDALKSAAGFIKSELASRVSLRIIPELEFIADDSISHGIKIASILEDLNIE